MSRLAYRKDIDGLRAVAVLLVVAYHFGLPFVTGGYIGVDVFFVISGFLIASLLEREPVITARVLADFYARRIKRLLPAFVFVALVVTTVAATLLLPDDFEAFLRSLRESFLFRSNAYFERATTGYFAANSAELPWLHTWSLAIEWQFYFVFPPLVWLLRRGPRRVFTGTLLAGAALGIAVSIAMTAAHPEHAYYSGYARFFEFLVGALAATSSIAALEATTARTVSALAVAGLVALSLLFERHTSFPGLNAAGVALLAFVAIVAGRSASVLSSDALAFVGRRSYALYLWHWPVVAFLAYLQRSPSALENGAWIALVFVLSDATHRWVERPGVASRWQLPATVAAGCVLPLLLTAAAHAFVRAHDGFPARFGPEAAHAAGNLRAFDAGGPDRCHDFRGGDIESCARGDVNGSRVALLIGDSHARQYEAFLQAMAERAHVKLYALTDSECLALEGVELPPRFATRVACREANASHFALIARRRFDFVLIAQRWIGYPQEEVARLDATLTTIEATGAVPIVIEPIAEDGGSPKDCFNRHLKLRTAYADDCVIARDNPFGREAKRRIATLIDGMRARHPTLVVIDPQAVQCTGDACATVIDGTPIYSDTHHLDAFGSAMLGRAWSLRFGDPFGPGIDRSLAGRSSR